MRVVAFVVTEGAMPAEAIAEMNRDWPAYAEELKHRPGMRLGRELNLPESGAATVRVRDGETLVTDGPFIETKEFLAGIEVFDCADLDEAIAVELRNPVARFNPFEIRPVSDRFRVGPQVNAFSEMDDSQGTPYLLTVWDTVTVEAVDDEERPALVHDCQNWRETQEERGSFVLGGEIGGPEVAKTLRPQNGEIAVCDGPFVTAPGFISAIEVVRAAAFDHVLKIAETHPLTSDQVIEVRSFYSEA